MPSPATCEAAERTPRLWVGSSELVYVGPALGTRMHSTAVPRVLVGLDGPFTLKRGGEEHTSRIAYIPPRIPHHVLSAGVWWAVTYLEPGSHRDIACRSTLPDTDELATRAGLGSGRLLLDACGPAGRPDTPLTHVIDRVLRHPSASLSADEAAALSLMSRSAFLHEFSRTTGTSFRRFRQWARLLEATRRATSGSLTVIAAEAGFASPSHFSDTVRGIFGFTASELLGTRVVIEAL